MPIHISKSMSDVPAQLSREQQAEMLMRQEMGRRATRSVFHADGRLDEQTAREMVASGSGNAFMGEYLHLAGITWAPEPDADEHCIQLARLTEYMCTITPKYGGYGPFSAHDTKVMHAVAMLYCTGRTTPSFSDTSPGPNRSTPHVDNYTPSADENWCAVSAANAERFFREGGGDGTYWGKVEVREDVCRLIFRHRDPRAVQEDRRLQIFADAVRYESARYFPNTMQGLGILKERWKKEFWFTGWAGDASNGRMWQIHRGWR